MHVIHVLLRLCVTMLPKKITELGTCVSHLIYSYFYFALVIHFGLKEDFMYNCFGQETVNLMIRPDAG